MNNYWVETTADDFQGGKELFNENEKSLIYDEIEKNGFSFIYDISLNMISVNKNHKNICIIKKGIDEWYFINLFIEDSFQWRRYFKCDQLDGLLLFINSINKIKKSFEKNENHVSNYQDFLRSNYSK